MSDRRSFWQKLIRPESSNSWFLAFGIALVAVAIATVARLSLNPALGNKSPFMMFILGIAIATWRGGWRSGTLAAPLSAAVVLVWIDPASGDSWQNIWINTARLGMFGTISLVIILLMSNLQAERNRLATAQAQLQEANDSLERKVAERTANLLEAQSELQALTHSVAHDVRAPLRAIMANATMLQREYAENLDESGLDMLERQRHNAVRLSSLIDDMLEFVRLNKSTPRISEVNASELARNIAADLEIRYKAKNVSFAIQDEIKVKADPTMLGCIFENLFENACKHSLKPDVTIEMRKRDLDGGTAITVSDDGNGFDPVYADKIFEPFQRLAGSKEVEGTGTGLANVRRMVELHGGYALSSSPGQGQGATFTIWLPNDGSKAPTKKAS